MPWQPLSPALFVQLSCLCWQFPPRGGIRPPVEHHARRRRESEVGRRASGAARRRVLHHRPLPRQQGSNPSSWRCTARDSGGSHAGYCGESGAAAAVLVQAGARKVALRRHRQRCHVGPRKYARSDAVRSDGPHLQEGRGGERRLHQQRDDGGGSPALHLRHRLLQIASMAVFYTCSRRCIAPAGMVRAHLRSSNYRCSD
mmetsp:Transcript_59557/g.98760  ORF Transcript_59557/g.98760 Transcript_59557/m.98760 type:complete len:200 (+) Transcript_59557:992-1591(+)